MAVVAVAVPTPLHVWAGISMLGATDIYIFTMDAQFYIRILEDTHF